MRKAVLVAAAGVLTLAACSKSSSGSPTGASPRSTRSTATANTVTVKATEFQFIMPDTIPAGVTTLHVENIGGMPHFLDIQGVTGPKTDDDVQAVLDDPASQNGPGPKWLTKVDVPGINLLSPGASTDVTLDLPAGRYVFFCWMSDANGTPHAFLGMHHVFDVSGTPQGTLPTPDFTVTSTDSGVTGVPDTIATGVQTIGYGNSGSKGSAVNVARILEDKPIAQVKKDVGAWFGSNYQGPAPLQFLGGLSGMAPGATNVGTTTVDLTPGVYAFFRNGDAPPEIRTVGGGGYPSPSPIATDTSCTPNGTSLSVTAKGSTFTTACLAAPANQDFTIMFDNQDINMHNIAIYPNGDGAKAVFTGDIEQGPKMATYDVKSLPAGTYRFQCDVHPTTMGGTLIVG